MTAVLHIVGLGVFLTLMVAVPVLATFWQNREYEARKRRYDEERARIDREFRLRAERRREILAAVARQQQDQPAVTVPVTHCERHERRRILKLEN